MNSLFQEAQSYIKVGNYAEAARCYERAIKNNPQNREFYVEAAICYFNDHNYECAREKLEKIIIDGLKTAEIYSALAKVYSSLGQYSKSIREYKRALLLAPKDQEIIIDYFDLCLQQKLFEEAYDLIQNAIQSNPKFEPYKLKLCELYITNNKIEEAKKIIESDKTLDTTINIKVNKLLARMAFEQNDYEIAEKLILSYLDKEHNDYNVFYFLGAIYEGLNNSEKALTYYLASNEKSFKLNNSLRIIHIYLFIKLDANKSLEILNLIKNEKLKIIKFYSACYYALIKDDKNYFQELNELRKNINYEKNYKYLLNFAEGYYLYLNQQYNESINKLINAQGINETFFEFNTFYNSYIEITSKLISSCYCKIKNDENKSSEINLNIDNYLSSIEKNTYTMLSTLHDLFKKSPNFEMFGNKLNNIIKEYSKPLNIVVMGEYNAGKSTFINSLIRENVLVTGNMPITATTNILKYGDEKKIRVIFNNNSIKEYDFSQIQNFTDETQISKEHKNLIKLVIVFYPNEVLKYINIIDTPGYNSGIELHDEIAKKSCEIADIILWIFSAGQAGKSTEKNIINYVKLFSNKTIGIINKIDNIKKEEEIENVINFLEDNFNDYFNKIFPYSAKNALDGFVNNSRDLLKKSRFTELYKYLKQNIINNAKNIKELSISNHLKIFIKDLKIYTEKLDNNRNVFSKVIKDIKFLLNNEKNSIEKNLHKILKHNTKDLHDNSISKISYSFIQCSLFNSSNDEFHSIDIPYLIDYIVDTYEDNIKTAANDFESYIIEIFETLENKIIAELHRINYSSIDIKCQLLKSIKRTSFLVFFEMIKRKIQYIRGNLEGSFYELYSQKFKNINIKSTTYNEISKIFHNSLPPYTAFMKEIFEEWYNDIHEDITCFLNELNSTIKSEQFEIKHFIINPFFETISNMGDSFHEK